MKNVSSKARVPSIPRLVAALKRRNLTDPQIEGFVTEAQSVNGSKQNRLTGARILATAKARRLGNQAEAILNEACGVEPTTDATTANPTRRADDATGAEHGEGGREPEAEPAGTDQLIGDRPTTTEGAATA